GIGQRKLLEVDIAHMRRREGDGARLSDVAACLERALDADEFRSQRLVALEGLEILRLFAEVPDAAVLGRNIPVVCRLMDHTTLEDLIPEHDAVYAGDSFRLVHNIHRVDLRRAAVFPMLSDSQWEIRIRV